MNNQIKVPPCHWLAEFHVEPSSKRSETIGGYDFDARNDGTYVEVKYDTSAFNEDLPGRKGEYAEETRACKHISEIRNIILKYMINNNNIKPIKISYKCKLLNKDELDEALKATGSELKRKVGASVSLGTTFVGPGGTLKDGLMLWNLGFKNRSKGCEDDILRIAHWVQLSEEETDKIKSFILSWISFNGLYGLFALINGKSNYDDASKFEYMIEELLKNDANNIIYTYKRGFLFTRSTDWSFQSSHLSSSNAC